ncbi:MULTISPECIES: MarR family winged helix-turn-helix transcriptional regulator [Burkholderia cepacia complex]|uniref:Transcriptional regulator, MarR family n=1 Tax=Burkholderia orbicola (strain MC0-3) TaxID=406425 RepID=B1K172_BURO0|nr:MULTISPECIES: MarR family transcriptional regulator [Burkholderia cepacia complex]ACA90826.1 transcriptional regulator, MarR family [Burkholderia orbicola MC0-3]MCA8083166.1 MarR family transcriptional regulator [Burkholderia cenocepacia]HEB3532805.1 MarR family transcriptional regulator [Burkholderia cenocepacia]
MDRAEHALAQWRAERPDLDATSMVVMGRLQEAALVIARDRLNPLFARYGMQPGEFDVLATLRRSGAPFALTPTALYDALMMSSGGMTARIDRLQKAGWVERRPNPADGRGTLVALTDAGRALIDEAVVAHIDNQRAVLAVLSAAEQAQLSELLGKLLAGIGRCDAGRGGWDVALKNA